MIMGLNKLPTSKTIKTLKEAKFKNYQISKMNKKKKSMMETVRKHRLKTKQKSLRPTDRFNKIREACIDDYGEPPWTAQQISKSIKKHGLKK